MTIPSFPARTDIKVQPSQKPRTPEKREKVAIRCVVVNQPDHPVDSNIEVQISQEFWYSLTAVIGAVVSHPLLLFTISVKVSHKVIDYKSEPSSFAPRATRGPYFSIPFIAFSKNVSPSELLSVETEGFMRETLAVWAVAVAWSLGS